MGIVREPIVLNRAENTTEVVELTEKQRRFCEEYIIDFNGARAATVAGYSKKLAQNTAYQLRQQPHVKMYIAHLQANLGEVTGITKHRVLQEHMKMAFSSIAHLHDTWVKRKEFEKLTAEQKSCIAEIHSETRTVKGIKTDYVRIKLYDKQRALDSIARMLGYDAATKLDVQGMPSSNVLNMQINVYNSGPPLLGNEKDVESKT